MNKRIHLLHPLLFGIYPIISLLSGNITETHLTDALRSFLISLVIPFILLIIFRLFTSNWDIAVVLSTLSIILFFSYGHIYDFFRETELFGFTIFRHRVLGSLWLAVFFAGIVFVRRRSTSLNNIHAALSLVGLIALSSPLYVLIRNIDTEQLQMETSILEQNNSQQASPDRSTYPDIYYIILDAYGREDFLREGMGINNGPFLELLQDKGFYVADCSQSNYSQTRLSLSSSLNMNYIEGFYDGRYDSPTELQVDAYKQELAQEHLKKSTLRGFLEERGYVTVAFETGAPWTELYDADIYIPVGQPAFWQRLDDGLNGFEVLFIRSTALSLLSATSPGLADILLPDLDYPNKIHRDRILFVLDSLENVPKIRSPKFVFAHIISPHGPFVFGPNGEPVQRNPIYANGYTNQLNYLNQRVLALIDILLEQSASPPVIILQGDHGPLLISEIARMGILNAYYFPDERTDLLYETVSPVNTFRIVLNEFFGEEFALLNDISYASPYTDPKDYKVIPQVHREVC